MVKLLKDATIAELINVCKHRKSCYRCPLNNKSLTSDCFIGNLKFIIEFDIGSNRDILNKEIHLHSK